MHPLLSVLTDGPVRRAIAQQRFHARERARRPRHEPLQGAEARLAVWRKPRIPVCGQGLLVERRTAGLGEQAVVGVDEVILRRALRVLRTGHNLDVGEVAVPIRKYQVESPVHGIVVVEPLERLLHGAAVLQHPAREGEGGHAVRARAHTRQPVQHHAKTRFVQPPFAPPGSGTTVVYEAVALAAPRPIALPGAQILGMIDPPVGGLADQWSVVGVDEADTGTMRSGLGAPDDCVRAVENEDAVQRLARPVSDSPCFLEKLRKVASEPFLHEADPRLGARCVDGSASQPGFAGEANRPRAGSSVLSTDLVGAAGVVQVNHASAPYIVRR